MDVEVELINERGRSLSDAERKTVQRHRGELRVNEDRSTRLGRTARVAQLISKTDTTEAPVLPALRDATVLFLRDRRMRIDGIEAVEAIEYAQTWDIRFRT